MLKRPAFTVIAVLTLALGIGLNTAIFSVINAVILRPLAYSDPSRLITFDSNQSGPDVADFEAQTHSFSKIGGENHRALDYTAGTEPLQIQIGQVTGGYFEALGVKAERGRAIAAADDKTGAPFVVVLSQTFWRQQFNGDPQIIGKTIPLSGNVYTIIGVMPAAFASPRAGIEAWTPVHVSDSDSADDRGVHYLRTYARLADGVTLEQARAEMRVVDQTLAAKYPADNKNRVSVLIPLQNALLASRDNRCWCYFASVSLVLLIACANFANLLLARSAERERSLLFELRSAPDGGD